MPFDIRAWLAARALGRARVELLWDRARDSGRELRYFCVARAVVVVVTVTPREGGGWEVEAQWPGGRIWTTVDENGPPVA